MDVCACIRRTVDIVHFQQGIETLSLISSSHSPFRHSIVVICESSNTSSSLVQYNYTVVLYYEGHGSSRYYPDMSSKKCAVFTISLLQTLCFSAIYLSTKKYQIVLDGFI